MVAFEPLAVEAAVLVVEIHDAQVPPRFEEVREVPERPIDVVDVVEGEHGDHEVEPLVRQLVAVGEVDLPHPGIRDQAGVDLVLHHLSHTGRGVGHRHRTDVVLQRLGEQAGAGAVLQQPLGARQRQRRADRRGDHLGALDLRRVVIPGRRPLVEARHARSSSLSARCPFGSPRYRWSTVPPRCDVSLDPSA